FTDSMESLQAVAFSFGGISLRVTPDADIKIGIDESLQEFFVSSSHCDLEFAVKWTAAIQEPSQTCEFDSGSLWRFFRAGDDNCFYFSTSFLGSEPYKYIRLNASLTQGEIFMNRKYFRAESTVYPLEYPADELLL